MFSAADQERFFSKVRKGSSCWWWMASTVKGYGQFVAGGKVWRAHRYSYVLKYGAIPEGLLVCHRCDERSCVNPDHLFLGTHQDNLDDMYAKGRDKTRKKPRRPRKLTDEQVLAIREDGRLLREIAADYGVSQALVSQIRHRRRRQYVDDT